MTTRVVLEHELVARIMLAPVEYLSVRAPRTLRAFLQGYGNALLHHGVGRLVSQVSFLGFRDWHLTQLRFRQNHAKGR